MSTKLISNYSFAKKGLDFGKFCFSGSLTSYSLQADKNNKNDRRSNSRPILQRSNISYIPNKIVLANWLKPKRIAIKNKALPEGLNDIIKIDN